MELDKANKHYKSNNKMVNNFKLISPFLNFDNEGDFYFIQIIQRKKDNPEIERNMNVINNYFCYDIEKFKSLEQRIIHECNAHNARAYIRLNVRNTKKVALQTLKKVTDLIISEDYKAVKNAFLSAAGEYHSQQYPRWIIDIDNKDYGYQMKVRSYAQYLITATPSSKTYIMFPGSIPTKNGIHIISHPFRLDLFKQQFPDVDVHKDNPTILYMP